MATGRYQTGSTRRRSRRRTLLLHLMAVIFVLSPLALGELALRLFVPAPPVRWEDPYVSFASPRPLFVPDAAGTRFETAPERLVAFRPQSFAATKGAKTFRIFCLGGSTVQGRPYSVETSFTTWLALTLQAAQPEVEWEIVNCGGISYASYRLVPVMKEVLGYEPDLLILYAGHNEFLEDRTYEALKRTPRILIQLHRTMLGLRSYALADRWLAGRRARRASQTVLPADVQTKLDLREGLGSYQRDSRWRQGIVEHFGQNLQTMVQMARRAGVPIILVNPVSNLKDCPPFKSEFRADLSPVQRERVTDLWARSDRLDWSQAHEKLGLVEQAAAIDDQHAGLLFATGTCYQHIGRPDEAKEWFVRAKDEDICPLRILEPMHRLIRETAVQYDLPFVDVRAMIEEHTEDGIPGKEWLLDHVHPTISGHKLIADALYQAIAEMDLVPSPDHWQDTREELWRRHLASLNEAYFAQGLARLERLRQWSRGRIPDSLEDTP